MKPAGVPLLPSPDIDGNHVKTSNSATQSILEAEERALQADDPYSEEYLPPIDGGIAAWKIVFGIWFTEGFLWGYPLCYGIFQSYYSHNPPFEGNKSLPIVGNLVTGISSLLMPLVAPLVLKNPHYQLHIMWFGWSLCVLGLIGASFATHVWHLLFFQGALYGVGWVFCYTPMLLVVNGWFVKRRGLVYGILFGAAGVTNIFMPFAIEALLQRYEYRITLRMMAFAAVIITGPPLCFVRPRTRPSAQAPSASTLDYSFLRNKRFYSFAFCVACQGIGFFFPHIFMPSFAHSLGLAKSQGAALVSLYSIFQVLGQMTMGHFSDKIDVHIPATLILLLPGLAVLLLWGPAKTFLHLAMFPIVYGFFAASFSVIWSSLSQYITDDPGTANTIFGMFSMIRGTLTVLAGPISTLLLGDRVVLSEYGLAKYKHIVLFTGCSMLVGSTIGLGYFWKKPEAGSKGLDASGDHRGSYELVSKLPQSTLETPSTAEFELDDSDEEKPP